MKNINKMMNKSTPFAADVSHCNTSITYFEVSIVDCYENDIVLGVYRSKENAEKHYQHLQARKQELIEELMKYPLKDYYNLDIYTEEGKYKWGDAFRDINGSIVLHSINYVKALKRGYSEDEAEQKISYEDYEITECTLKFDD